MWLMILILFFTNLLTFLSECTEVSDCPNAGKDFQCNSNFCECESGFYFDGFSCADGKWFVHLSGPVRVNQAVGEEHFDEKIFNFQF